MGEPGKAMMGTALAQGPDRARVAAEQAVACPLLDGVDLTGAKGVLVLITAAKNSLKLSESKLAMNTIREKASPDALVIYGTAYDDSLGDDLRVTVVATGLRVQSQSRIQHRPPMEMLRTGTDGNWATNVEVHPGGQSRSETSALASTSMAVGGLHVDFNRPDSFRALETPSVFRAHPNRTMAAARVDALSSSGMDDLDIPAFLRKQAD
jgi:cell division protein FtsZ